MDVAFILLFMLGIYGIGLGIWKLVILKYLSYLKNVVGNNFEVEKLSHKIKALCIGDLVYALFGLAFSAYISSTILILTDSILLAVIVIICALLGITLSIHETLGTLKFINNINNALEVSA